MTPPKALISFHCPDRERNFTSFLGRIGWDVTSVPGLEGVLDRLPEGGLSSPYGFIALDANLMTKERDDISPVVQVYTRLKSALEAGVATLVALSGTDDVLNIARQEGIYCLNKAEMGQFLKTAKQAYTGEHIFY
jgi:hypothetical protein